MHAQAHIYVLQMGYKQSVPCSSRVHLFGLWGSWWSSDLVLVLRVNWITPSMKSVGSIVNIRTVIYLCLDPTFPFEIYTWHDKYENNFGHFHNFFLLSICQLDLITLALFRHHTNIARPHLQVISGSKRQPVNFLDRWGNMGHWIKFPNHGMEKPISRQKAKCFNLKKESF